MPTGTVKSKGDQGMKATSAKLGTITEDDSKDLVYFDNRKGLNVKRKVKWDKTVTLGSYLIALNVKTNGRPKKS